jgi:uncharacterized membrane protein YphA (DoxX/SURF4 family)
MRLMSSMKRSTSKNSVMGAYCFVFLFISSQGSGIWSVDAARRKS